MLFNLGAIVATPGALRCCTLASVDAMSLINRHAAGDFGDLCYEDTQANVQAVQHDLRILSSYVVGGEKLYVITEWDRSVTTLLLASDY